ncbi:pyridoxamine 5'-phosphate oxidase family protein [Maritimibacter sp. DP1N21-5]|nr:pyridoxamine 5'-phosphate oxidase family protein [Maritimibacter sp. DP1N21-5]MBV7407470.1 pyridoxamine 5'-phosphate oxidase family protein [Maritimibacter sp. DP1N21-5]
MAASPAARCATPRASRAASYTTPRGTTSDVAFTPTVKDIQTRNGSRKAYANQEQAGGWRTEITLDLKAFIEGQTSLFMATANAEGQPYIQHRGGPAGFLKVIDPQTLGFVDYVGNRQFITTGNLVDNPKAYLFLIDYANRRRIKIWGTAKVIEEDGRLVADLMPAGYKARAEQVILFTVSAWDANCPQHIPQRFEAADVAAALAARDARIAALEAEVAKLKASGRDQTLEAIVGRCSG